MGTHPIFESDFDCLTDCDGGSQRSPKQAYFGEEAEAKSARAELVPLQDRKYNQVQRQETSLATNQDRIINCQPRLTAFFCQTQKSLGNLYAILFDSRIEFLLTLRIK